jgi:ribosomal protein S18 acetylase RimI-like enzyme
MTPSVTPAGFEIRPGVVSDAECLARLNAGVHALHLRERPEFFRATDTGELCEWFRELLTKPTTRTWIASVGADAAGYVLMREHQRAATVFCLARHWHEIEQIGVDAAFRRRGIGQALLRTALAAAVATGASDVELASWSFNRDAHALFERCGFAPRLLRFDRRLDDPSG